MDHEHVTAPRTAHDEGAVCICVVNHNPNPMELNIHHVQPLANGGADDDTNRVWLCPTAHVNVHELMRHWFRLGGPPPAEIRMRFNSYIRELAREGYLPLGSNYVGGLQNAWITAEGRTSSRVSDSCSVL